MPPVLLVLAMPSNCSAPVMCLTASIALPTEAIANALRLHWAQAPHQSLSTAIVSVCEVGVYLELEEAGKTRDIYNLYPRGLQTGTPTLLGIGGLLPLPINRALRRVPKPGALPSRSDRPPVTGTCLEDTAVG